MIYIDIEDLGFYDDAVVLVRSFYPRTEVAIMRPDVVLENDDLVISVDIPEVEGREKKDIHEDFKRELYLKLSEETGIELPWGYLTGVRPSKIAYTRLEENVSEKDILHEFTDKYFATPKKAELALKVAKTEKQILEDLDYRSGYSLYIGIPFCPTTCLYCSFTSYSQVAYASKIEPYVEALIKEMHYVSEAMAGQRLDTVYFGGGTPTTLSAEQLDRVLTELETCFDMGTVKELTVEAGRPDSITMEKLLVLKKHNVDRISINPQTMNDATLAVIGRRHSVAQVIQAFEMAREAGFDNINMDIILGLPGESIEEVRRTLEKIKELGPESLTVHSLAIKRAAALNIWRDKYADMQIENSDEIVQLAADYAKEMGHEPYYMYRQKNMAGNLENVGYSVPGKECIYNILIMEEKQTIIAIGAGASSKVVFYNMITGKQGRIERIENVKDVTNYIERIDEMIVRKETFFANNSDDSFDNMINDFKSGISHGIIVANLAYRLAKRLGLSEEDAYEIKLAGLVHDVGKLKLSQYLYGRNSSGLSIEEMKYMRMHSKMGYDYLKECDFSDCVLQAVLSHHECFDGSGYPDNLEAEDIPLSARIIRVVDSFAAFISDRPYRKAFDYETAVEIMIEENKNFDIRVFIEFQRMIHEPETIELIKSSNISLDDLDIRDILSN
ncbi:MAG: coproporphyrinogen dehydrogenase HemZ [Lachnospira sp.]|nr:coproporphyrinogen dehydrogenase HemZ [Lachnospira sp.]